jgi:murein L,D-transpeptidase YcbB/YkuD
VIFCLSVQPFAPGYFELKKGIAKFIDSMDTRKYTYVKYPYKKGDAEDSLAFINELQLRLSESGFLKYDKKQLADSAALASAITKYQQKKKLTADGKISTSLIKAMNLTDQERFNRIAVTLDRYKQLAAGNAGEIYMGKPPGLLPPCARQRFYRPSFKNHLWQTWNTYTYTHQRYYRYGYLSYLDGSRKHH